MFTVYGITDEHGQIRYVGQTENPKQRFAQHRSTQHSFNVTGFAVLACTEDWSDEEEGKWIDFFGLENLINRNRAYPPILDFEPEPEITPRVCDNDSCNVQFIPLTVWQRFHCRKCRDVFHNRLKQRLIETAKKMGIK